MAENKQNVVKSEKAIEVNGKKVGTVKEINQNALTGDCWTVQMNGLDACADCEFYGTKRCGGGATLMHMIIDYFDNYGAWLHREVERYFDENPDDTFNALVQTLERSERNPHLMLPIRRYKTYINKLRTVNSEEKKERLDDKFPYMKIREEGELLEKSGYHQPVSEGKYACGCELVTDKGAYRDEVYEYEGVKLYYLHQHCIVAEYDEKYLLDDADYRTKTTRGRMNVYVDGYRIYQEDYEWFIEEKEDDVEIDFHAGIEIPKV